MADITINLKVAPGSAARVPTTWRAYGATPGGFLLNDAAKTAVAESSPHNGGVPFKTGALTPSGYGYTGTAVLYSTTDSPDRPNDARWGIHVFDANDRWMYAVAGLEAFWLEPSPTTVTAEDVRANMLGTIPPSSNGARTVSSLHVTGATQLDGPVTSNDTFDLNDDLNVAGDLTVGGVITGDAAGLTNLPTPSGGGPAYDSLQGDASTWTRYQANNGGVGRYDVYRGAPGVSVLGFDATGKLDKLVGITGIGLTIIKSALHANNVFDPNSAPYNATPDDAGTPDNGARIAEAIADAVAWGQANNGTGVVPLDNGEYFLNDALSTDNDCYAQIPLPALALGDARASVLIEAKSYVVSPTPFQNPGIGASVLLHSTLTGQVYDPTPGAGTPCIMGGPDSVNASPGSRNWSFISIHLKGISMRAPNNPTVAGFNGRNIENIIIEDCRFDVEGVTSLPADFGEPTHPWAVAVLLQDDGGNGAEYRGYNTANGFYGGFGTSEVLTNSGTLFPYRCKVGIVIQSPWYHAAHLGHVEAVGCPYVLAAIDPATGLTNVTGLAGTYHTALNLETLVIEEANPPTLAPAWAAPVAYIYDPSSRLTGRLNFRKIVGGVGNDVGFRLAAPHHARNFVYRDLAAPEYTPDAVYDRLFGPAGKALTALRPQRNQGSGWELPAPSAPTTYTSFLFNAGGAAIGQGASQNTNVIETNLADGVISVNGRFTSTGSGSMGLVFRYATEHSFLLLEWAASTGLVSLVKKTAANTFTTLGSATIAPTANKYYAIVVVLSGNSVKAYVDGTQIASVTDSHNSTSTKHGLTGFSNTALLVGFKASLT